MPQKTGLLVFTLLLPILLGGSPALAANSAPVLAALEPKEVLAGETLTLQLSAFDRDGQPLTYSASNLPAGAALDPNSGLFSWTPAINQLGSYRITFTATDNGAPPLADSKSVALKVVFRTVQQDKAWGFGVSGQQTLVETSDPAELTPRLAGLEIDGQKQAVGPGALSCSDSPVIKLAVSSPYDIDRNTLVVLLDGAPVSNPTFADISTFGPENHILSLTVQVNPAGLAPGAHTLAVRASNALGTNTESLSLNVGAARLSGAPLTFPSPYNPASGPVIIQYTLSQSTDIDIMIVSSSGEIVKKISISRGNEGARPGLNKPSWDGKTDLGTIASNGIFVVAIMEKAGQKILGKTRLTVFR